MKRRGWFQPRLDWHKVCLEFLLEAGAFAGAVAQEIQARAAGDVVAFDHHFVDARRAREEGALHTDAVGCHAAYGDGLVITALAGADDCTLEFLDTLAFTFLDLDVHADVIASADCWYIFVLFGFESLYDV